MTGNHKKRGKHAAELGAVGGGTEPGEAGWREGEYTPLRPSWRLPAGGSMGVLSTGDIRYHPSATASELLTRWERVFIEFKVDGETRKPVAVRLTAALAGQFGYKVKRYGGQRPRVDIPTSAVGLPVRDRRHAVEERISPNEIEVDLPFEFR